MLAELSSTDVAEWQAYAAVEWLPNERLEWLLAALCTITTNANRGKDDRPTTMQDFMPWRAADFEDDDEPASQVDMVKKIEALNAAFGGRDERGQQGDE